MQRVYNLFYEKKKEAVLQPLTFEAMPADVIIHISGFLAYNKDLFHLQMTSMTMFNLVETTPAGILARQAFNLMDSIQNTHIAATLAAGMGLIGTSLTGGCFYLIKHYIDNPYLSVGLLIISPVVSLTMGASAGWGLSFYCNNNKLKLFHKIRHQLEEPVTVEEFNLPPCRS